MNVEKTIKEANLKIASEKIKYNEEMKNYTSFKIGGPAECLIKIDNTEELKEILKLAQEKTDTTNNTRKWKQCIDIRQRNRKE